MIEQEVQYVCIDQGVIGVVIQCVYGQLCFCGCFFYDCIEGGIDYVVQCWSDWQCEGGIVGGGGSGEGYIGIYVGIFIVG